MIIALVGESGSGKTSVSKYLVKNSKYNIENIVTYTTRPPRNTEIDGIDYHFMSEEQFIDRGSEDFFAEIGIYNEWMYGTSNESITNNSTKNKIIILTPYGLRQIRNKGIDIYTVYLYVPRRDRLIKMLERGDNIEEAYRRNLSDVGQFDGIYDEADLIIKNPEYKITVQKIAEEILNKIHS